MLLFKFLLFLLLVQNYPATGKEYESGLERYENGQISEALDIWLGAFNTYKDTDDIDPRIGWKFGEVVAEHTMTRLYEVATMIYYWSLTAEGKEVQPFLTEAVLQSQVVFDSFDINKVEKRSRRDPVGMAGDLLMQWKQMDPTPGTVINERLIEHWQRVVHAKKHFNKAKNTIYGTDDRALLYVRFGKPDVIHSGTLELNEAIIKSEISDIIDVSNTFYKKIIKNFYPADYEIWIYEGLSTRGRIVELFGDNASTLRFERINQVKDFIPAYAFNLTEIGSGGARKRMISPGFILMHNYLRQFFTYDVVFEDLFRTLNYRMMEIESKNHQLGGSMNRIDGGQGWLNAVTYEKVGEMNQIISAAPLQHSTADSSIKDIEVASRTYQFFSENGSPSYYHIMNSYPIPYIADFMSKDKAEDLSRYKIRHTFSVGSEKNMIFEPHMDEPAIPMVSKLMEHPAQSIFKLNTGNADLTYSFRVELTDIKRSNRLRENELFPQSLLGHGFTEVTVDKIDDMPTDMMIPDIMIGYVGSEPDWEQDVPFIVALDNKIPGFSNMYMHFQVVNTTLNDDGMSDLQIELSVREGKKLLGLFRKKAQNSIRTSYQASSRIVSGNLEFDLQDRETGEYELVFTVYDLNSGEEATKVIPFEIIKTE